MIVHSHCVVASFVPFQLEVEFQHIDRVTGRQEELFCFERDYIIEVVVVNENRFYMIDMFSESPLSETDRAIFTKFLASFRFDEPVSG